MGYSEGGVPIHDQLSGASNILVLVPSMAAGEEDLCMDLLTIEEPEDANVLAVDLTHTPDDRIAAWDEHVGVRPAALQLVSVGDTVRSTAAASATPDPPVDIVADPGDLTGIGMAVTKYLERWADDDARAVFCLHSLSALLQYADLERAFQFLHVLSGRFDAIDAVAHYHMDPSAHDERTVNTIASLFDAVVEYRDGEWRVRKR